MMKLPTVSALDEAMRESGCQVWGTWCRTHDSSLLIHDGGRVACAYAWRKVA